MDALMDPGMKRKNNRWRNHCVRTLYADRSQKNAGWCFPGGGRLGLS